MSDEELALLRAVAAAPADDTARLVYADWLDEHGRAARAEFIRLQVELAKKAQLPPAIRPHSVDLERRQQQLQDDHYDELLGPFAGLGGVEEFTFDRGFVDALTLDVDTFLRHAAALAAAVPAPAVEVEGVSARLSEFLQCPHLGLVTRIAAHSAEAAENGTEFPSDDDLIAARNRLTNLKSLDLEDCRIGDFGAGILARADFPALVEADLSGNHITDFGVVELLAWPSIRRLRRLVLGGNPIGDQGAFELADRLGPRNQIEDLNLRFTEIGRDGQRALLARFGGRLQLF